MSMETVTLTRTTQPSQRLSETLTATATLTWMMRLWPRKEATARMVPLVVMQQVPILQPLEMEAMLPVTTVSEALEWATMLSQTTPLQLELAAMASVAILPVQTLWATILLAAEQVPMASERTATTWMAPPLVRTMVRELVMVLATTPRVLMPWATTLLALALMLLVLMLSAMILPVLELVMQALPTAGTRPVMVQVQLVPVQAQMPQEPMLSATTLLLEMLVPVLVRVVQAAMPPALMPLATILLLEAPTPVLARLVLVQLVPVQAPMLPELMRSVTILLQEALVQVLIRLVQVTMRQELMPLATTLLLEVLEQLLMVLVPLVLVVLRTTASSLRQSTAWAVSRRSRSQLLVLSPLPALVLMLVPVLVLALVLAAPMLVTAMSSPMVGMPAQLAVRVRTASSRLSPFNLCQRRARAPLVLAQTLLAMPQLARTPGKMLKETPSRPTFFATPSMPRPASQLFTTQSW
jgi:hypothetical protein